MSNAPRCALAILLFATPLMASPSLVTNHASSDIRGAASESRPAKGVRAEDAGIYFSGSFGYGIGGGVAVLKADNVSNPNGTATGPLRFSLWFTTNSFPSAGTNTASYDITPSLAAGQSISPVNGGNTTVPFTDPPTGCYRVTLVLEENVSGTWTARDWGQFSLSFDIGGGCITSFTATPPTVASGGATTLAWTTTGASVNSVSIDNGIGSKPANGSTPVNPTVTTIYTLSAFSTANSLPPTRKVKVTVAGIWTPVGPDGGVVFDVAIDPSSQNNLFAATLAGAFRSTDSGGHWAKVFGLECSAIAVHPTNSSIVFLADRNRQVFKSTDGGLTFALSSGGISAVIQPSIFGRFAFQPGNPSVMYYAWPRGLFKSTDGGVNWVASDAGAVNNQSVRELAVDSGNALVVYLVLSSLGVYKSVDGGATWNPFNNGLPFTGPTISISAFAQDSSSPQTLYAVSGKDLKLYVSTDGAATWTVRSSAAIGSINSLLVTPQIGQILYAGGNDSSGASPTRLNRIFKSINGGVDWSVVSSGITGSYNSAAVLAIPTSTPQTLYANLGNGLSRTTDSTSTWTAINTGLRAEEADYKIAFAPTSPSTWYVEYQQSGIYGTVNNGTTMFSANGNLVYAGIGTVVVDPTNPSILLAAGSTLAQATSDITYTSFLVRSTDGGGSWSPVNNPGFPSTFTSLQAWGFVTAPTNPTTYFAMAAAEGVYKSTDGGINFVAAKTGLPTSGVQFRGIAAADNSGTTLYCATTNGLFKTSNGGASWATPGTGLPGGFYSDVAVSPSAPQRVIALFGTGLYLSTDSGATWNPIAASFPSTPVAMAMSPSSPTTIYVGGTTTGATSRTVWVQRSLDGGVTWNALTSQGLDLISTFAMSVDPANPNHIVIGSRGGLSELTVSPPTVSLVSPATGNVAGGTSVTITGTDFTTGATVTFDGVPATNVAFVNSTTLTATTPAHAVGAVNVVVTNADGQSGTRTSGFTYSTALAAPTNVVATATSTTQVNVTWNASAGATSYQVFRRSAATGGAFPLVNSPATNAYTDTTVTPGNSYSYIVRAVNASTTSVDSTQDLAITILFTDDPLVVGTTIAKAVHLTELRTAANAVRALAGVPAFTFTGAVTAGTTITAAQVNEVRTALDNGMLPLARPTGGFTDTLTAGVSIKAVHLQEIRNRAK